MKIEKSIEKKLKTIVKPDKISKKPKETKEIKENASEKLKKSGPLKKAPETSKTQEIPAKQAKIPQKPTYKSSSRSVTSRSQNLESKLIKKPIDSKFLSPSTKTKPISLSKKTLISPIKKLQSNELKALPNSRTDLKFSNKKDLKIESKENLKIPKNDLKTEAKIIKKTVAKPKITHYKNKRDSKPQILNVFESIESTKPQKSWNSSKILLKSKNSGEKQAFQSKTRLTQANLPTKNKENGLSAEKPLKKELKNALGVLLNITKTVANEGKPLKNPEEASPELSFQKYDRILDYAMRLSLELKTELSDN